MAGVLFIIWIPCERYEQILTNKQLWGNTLPNSSKNLSKQYVESSSDDDAKNSKQSSLETFAVSIESDSLNRIDKKSANRRKQFEKTKSVDDLTTYSNNAKEKIPDDRLREKQGSIDSDTFMRLTEQRTRLRENEEAVDKFFNAKLERPLDENASMERVMREIVDQMRIKNSSWVRVNSGNSYQITFSLENGVRCDDTIHMLSEFGIGQREGSSIAIVPCTLYHDHHRTAKDEDAETTSSQSILKETAWNKFIGTVRARMNVAKIVEAVKSDASLTFDFIVLLIVASILASFGLVENSTLFLAASMLISPLMGPILAATFGAVIKDHKLQYWGIANEIIGIFMCIFVGFVFGLLKCALGENLGLTPEMQTRTDLHSVIVGICIALPSGAAVAIAVLGDNFGSLVGVAISASLLPPAVNTGLLWSFSCVHMIFKDFGRFDTFVESKKYSDDQAIELLALGGISLCVTLTNVLCIYVMGFFFLKVKEVAPASDHQRQFWKHDIKIARDYNKTVHADEGRKLQEELNHFHEHESDNFKGVGAELLKQSFHPHATWSPLTLRHYRKELHNTRTSLREFEALYMGMGGKNAGGEKHHRHFGFSRSSSPPHETLPDLSRNKHSNPIYTASPKHINNEYKCGSAPLEIITEMPRPIQQESTLVSIDGPAGTSGANKKKFTVTPAQDPLV